MDYKIDCTYDEQITKVANVTPPVNGQPNSGISAILRNIRQAQYPNSRVNQPISNFQAFLPNTITTATSNRSQNVASQNAQNSQYMVDYGKEENHVLDYNPPTSAGERIKICGKQPVARMSSENMKLYASTKNHTKFPVPLPTIGTNHIDTLSDNKITSFNYVHYAPTPNDQYVTCPIYNGDLSQENTELHDQYIANVEQNRVNMYNGIIDDMNILCDDGLGY